MPYTVLNADKRKIVANKYLRFQERWESSKIYGDLNVKQSKFSPARKAKFAGEMVVYMLALRVTDRGLQFCVARGSVLTTTRNSDRTLILNCGFVRDFEPNWRFSAHHVWHDRLCARRICRMLVLYCAVMSGNDHDWALAVRISSKLPVALSRRCNMVWKSRRIIPVLVTLRSPPGRDFLNWVYKSGKHFSDLLFTMPQDYWSEHKTRLNLTGDRAIRP